MGLNFVLFSCLVGCAKTRRLLALTARQSFPSLPPAHSLTAAQREVPAFSPNNLPSCRDDRPDLFTARQCNARDCFCVNVTTGVFFPGTRTSSADLGNCGTGKCRCCESLSFPKSERHDGQVQLRGSEQYKFNNCSLVRCVVWGVRV